MSRATKLRRAIGKRHDVGAVSSNPIEDDSTTGCDSRCGADAAQNHFLIDAPCARPAHQGADVIAR
jgi:hypothetical protein